jgi:capsule polysaccharide modification protein KpsS
LFTVDKLGWAGGAEYVDTFKPREIETCGTSFDKLAKYIKSGGSKFVQPPSMNLDMPKPFIFVPLQLPHDETLQWHSDVSCVEFVEKLCKWADSSEGNPMVLFKGHPVNLASMEPLFEIIKKYKNVAYATDISIHDAIPKAVATYVINSGTGQEAMLHDASVVCFGRCDYQGAIIQGKMDDLDFTYDAVKHDDMDKRKELYRKWYKWYIELTVDSK